MTDDDGDLRYQYVGSLGPLPPSIELADGAVELDVHVRDTAIIDVVAWSEHGVDGPLAVLQLTPTDARALAGLLLAAAGQRPGEAHAITN